MQISIDPAFAISVFYLTFTALVTWYGIKKGRGWAAFLSSFFFSPIIGIIVVAILGESTEARKKRYAKDLKLRVGAIKDYLAVHPNDPLLEELGLKPQ